MEKPKVKLLGQNGNTLNLLAICSKAMRKAGMSKEIEELTNKVFSSDSQKEAIQHMMEYCEVS